MSSLIESLVIAGVFVALLVLIIKWAWPFTLWSEVAISKMGYCQVHYPPGADRRDQNFLVSVRLNRGMDLSEPGKIITRFRECGLCLASKADLDMLCSAAYNLADPGEALVIRGHLGGYKLISAPNGYPVAQRLPTTQDIWLLTRCRY